MNCKEIKNLDIIEQYILKNLPENKATEFEEHYIECKNCLEDLRFMQNVIEGTRRAVEEGKLVYEPIKKEKISIIKMLQSFWNLFSYPVILKNPLFRYSIATAIVLISLYSVLLVYSHINLSKHYKEASIKPYRKILEEMKSESRTERSVEVDHFVYGTKLLLNADQSWFGLFPHYNQDYIKEALIHFKSILEEEKPNDNFKRSEIYFYIAKAYQMKNDPCSTFHWIEKVDYYHKKFKIRDYYTEDAIKLFNSIPMVKYVLCKWVKNQY